MKRLTVTLTLCLLLCGCAGRAEAPTPALRSDNGRPAVQVGEDVYYWQYRADSVEPEGLWGVYAPLPTAENALVRLSADGTRETVYAGPCYGGLWYLDGYLFAQSPAETESGISSLTCLTLDGEALWTLDCADVLAADMERGFLLCQDAWGYGTLFLLSADGARTELWKDARFLTYEDGAVYVQTVTDGFENVLCRVGLKGRATELARTDRAEDRSFEIVQVESVGGTVYFLWGAYAGTANVFQGGELCEVSADGTGLRVLAETGGWGGDRFFLRREEERTSLLYSTGFEDAAVRELDVDTGASEEGDFGMAGLRAPFLADDGALRWYPDHTGRAETLTAPIVFPAAADVQKVRDVAVTEDWVWYTLETGRWSADASVGWRDGYARQRTWVCRERRGGGEREVLYEY